MILKNGKRIDGTYDNLPIGVIQSFVGLTPPAGYLLCQGQKVSKSTYNELYNICKSLFGQETETEFYLPDLRGKTIAGYDSRDSSMNTIGKLLGVKEHNHIIPTHTHTIPEHSHTSAPHSHSTGNHTLTENEMPAHVHYDGTQSSTGINGPEGNSTAVVYWNNESGRSTTSAGGSQPHNHGNTGTTTPNNTGAVSLKTDSNVSSNTNTITNFQPTVVTNWIIKACMVVPNGSIVEDSLTSDSSINALSAKQGKILNDKINDRYNSVIKYGDGLLTTNPFGGKSLYISKIDNAFYAANQRWNVTLEQNKKGVITSIPTNYLFNGNYEDTNDLEAGTTGKLTIDFGGSHPGYIYGDIYISFYYINTPKNVSARCYCNFEPHGIGWHDLNVELYYEDGIGQKIYKIRNWAHNVSIFEINIEAQDNNDCKISQVEMSLDRPYLEDSSVVTKNGPETLYYPLTAPSFNTSGNYYINNQPIIETNGNKYGTWVKFSDGTMICYGATAAPTIKTIDLPKTFIQAPFIFSQPINHGLGSGEPELVTQISNVGISSFKMWCKYFKKESGDWGGAGETVHWFALGRWR